MKKYLPILIILFSINLTAQIPNAGFENWTAGNPDDWFSTNMPGVLTNIFQSSDRYSGNSALRGDVIAHIMPADPVYEPIIQSGTDAQGFGVTQRYGSVKGYYKFTSVNNDRFGCNFSMYKDGIAIAVGALTLTAAASWTPFEVTFGYFNGSIPDTCILQFLIIGATTGNANIGSSFIIDELSFGNVTDAGEDINTVFTFGLEQNYPNPFNPSTKIRYTVPQNGNLSNVSLKVYDVLGNLAAELVNEQQPAGSYEALFNASRLSSGVYIYTLRVNELVETKTMILMK